MALKPNMGINPKDALGSAKLPMHLWPETATAVGCLAFLDGAGKYGRSNFRATPIRASVYVAAAKRHLNAWFEGEAIADDSGIPHLGHALACLAILVDAEAAGNLHDDRQFHGDGYLKLVAQLTPLVAKLEAKNAGRDPKHYTIADNTVTKGKK